MGGRAGKVTLFARRHRRGLAFLLAFAGAVLLVSAVRGEPEQWSAVVVRTDLPAGRVLTETDLLPVQLSTASRPATAVSDPSDAVGRMLAGPMAAGEMLLVNRIVGPGLLAGAPSDQVALPIRLAEPSEAAFLQPGDVVDVFAASRSTAVDGEQPSRDAQVVAQSVRVLAAPSPDTTDTGLLGAPAGAASGAAVLIVAVPADQASVIAGAAVGAELSVALRDAGTAR